MWDLILVAGSLAVGGLITYYVTKNFSHRSTLNFDLTTSGIFNANDFGRNFSITDGKQTYDNLAVINLSIELKGNHDLVEQSIRENPHIDFENLQILSLKTLNNDESRFYIPLAVSKDSRRIYINMKDLRAGTKAVFSLVATIHDRESGLMPAEFFPGRIANTDVRTSGLIKRPWKTTSK